MINFSRGICTNRNMIAISFKILHFNGSGIVDLSGSMLIHPKKDIELLFEGSEDKMTFKAGQTYIILKGEHGNDTMIIVNEKNIMDLPPVIQKQIINEFQI